MNTARRLALLLLLFSLRPAPAVAQVTVSGEATATLGARDDIAFFNYTDYEHNALRMFRVSLSGMWRPAARLAFVAELQSEDAQRVIPYALYVRVRPWAGRAFDIQAGRIPPVFGAFGRPRGRTAQLARRGARADPHLPVRAGGRLVLMPSLVVLATVLALGAFSRPSAPGPTSEAATGAIRVRVEVRGSGGAREMRPDPGALGMPPPPDPRDRRRSVVYLETAPRGAFDPDEARRARMDQRNERFVPHVLAVTAGTWVDFPNGDKTYHNVFSLSKTREFNLGRYAAGRSKAVRFEQPGIVRVFCEIHLHMSAFILVFAHRYSAVTDDDGRYRLEGVPPGTYTLAVWNETVHGDPPRRIVTIGESGGEVEADFTIR